MNDINKINKKSIKTSLLKIFSVAIFVVLIQGFGCKNVYEKNHEGNPQTDTQKKIENEGVTEMPKMILFVIAQKNFRDEELKIPKSILESKGFKCEIASKTTENAHGTLGTVIKPDLSAKDALKRIDMYEAVVFIGGSGMQAYFNDEEYLSIARAAYEKNKRVAAICIAPVILANAGILHGKNATVWDGEFKEMIEARGASYVARDVVADNNIVTANGPHAADAFGRKIFELIS